MNATNEIILVGTFHFEQAVERVQGKENAIIELVEHLATFTPTKLALEWEQDNNIELNKKYHRNINQLEMNEVEQICFRLGRKLGLKEVFAVNWEGHITAQDMMSLNETIQESYPDIFHKVQTYVEECNKVSGEEKLIHSYIALNNEKSIKKLEEMYLFFVQVNSGEGEIGITFLNKWVERELKIFRNVIEVSEASSERVLLLVGSDHVWMLKNLFEGIGWRVINPFE